MDVVQPDTTCVFEGFRFDRRCRLLERMGPHGPAPEPLGSRALDVLVVLLGRAGQVVSKREIMDAVWPGLAVEENNLTVQMSSLRRALDIGRDGPSLIQTVPGRGYRFRAVVTEPMPPPQPLPTQPPPTSVTIPALATIPLTMARGLGWPLAAATATASGLAVAAAVLLWPATAPLPRLSVAVLPFEVSGSAPVAELSKAVTGEITTRLLSTPGAHIVAPGFVAAAAARDVDLQHIARDLQVRYLITGSLRCVASSLRVTAQIIDGASGKQLATRWFDRSCAAEVDPRAEIVRNIVPVFSKRLLDIEAARLEKLPEEHQTVEDLLLRERAMRHHNLGPEQNDHAIALLDRALTLDPKSVAVLTELVERLLRPANQRFEHVATASYVRRGRALAERARALAPDDSGVLRTEANLLFIEGRFEDGRAAYQQLLAKAPDNRMYKNQIAFCDERLGHPQQAIVLLQEAIAAWPDSDAPPYPQEVNLGRAFLDLGYDKTALEWFRRSQQHAPPGIASTSFYASAALAHLGRSEEAAAELRDYRDRQPAATLRGWRHRVAINDDVRRSRQHLIDGLALAGLPDHLDPAAAVSAKDFGPVIPVIDTEGLQAWLAKADSPLVLVADTQHDEVPRGAIAVATTSVDALDEDGLRDAAAQWTGGDNGRRLVVTGWNVGARAGRDLATRLTALGYRNVTWFSGGTEAWDLAGLPMDPWHPTLAQLAEPSLDR